MLREFFYLNRKKKSAVCQKKIHPYFLCNSKVKIGKNIRIFILKSVQILTEINRLNYFLTG